MNDFIREVKDDLKKERFEKILHQHGKTIIAFAILVVIGVGAGTWYKGYTIKQQQSSSNQYLDAMTQKHHQKLGALSTLISDGTSGIQAVSAFTKAKFLYENAEIEASITQYQKIVDNSSNDVEARDLAQLFIASIILESDSESAIKSLDSLISSNSVWSDSATELKAVIELNNGQTEDAIKLLNDITRSGSAPLSMRNRAKNILSVTPVSTADTGSKE